MTWLFWITYLLAALNAWLLIFVMAEDRRATTRLADHVLYLGMAIVWPVLPFLILGPAVKDWWTERHTRKEAP